MATNIYSLPGTWVTFGGQVSDEVSHFQLLQF